MADQQTGWYAWCEASIVSSTDTTVTIKVTSYWKDDGWTYDINYVSSWVYCGDSSYQVMNSGSVDTTSTGEQNLGSYSFTIDKTTEPQSISCYSKITSNSSYVSGTDLSDTIVITVPAKTSGVVYIDNGTTLEKYYVYIDNGTSWDLYVPYIDDGTDWSTVL